MPLLLIKKYILNFQTGKVQNMFHEIPIYSFKFMWKSVYMTGSQGSYREAYNDHLSQGLRNLSTPHGYTPGKP